MIQCQRLLVVLWPETMVNIPSMLLCVVQTAVKLLETRIDSVKAATDPSASALAPAAAAAAAVSQQPAAAHDSQHSTPAVSTSTGAAQPSPVALEAPTGPATASTSAAAVHSGSAVPEASVDRSAHQTSTSAPHSAPQALSDAPCAQTESTATPGASDASATGTTAEVAASSDAAVPDPTGVEGTRGFAGESIAGLQAEAAQKELADLESVLEDMYEKVEELQQIVKEQISTKNALKVSACVQCLCTCTDCWSWLVFCCCNGLHERHLVHRKGNTVDGMCYLDTGLSGAAATCWVSNASSSCYYMSVHSFMANPC